MSRRVLMIAYHFPPVGGIASLRSLRFARRLPELGWEALVVTPARGDYVHDPSLTFPAERTVRTGNLELSRAGRGALGLEAGQAGRLAPRSPLGRLRDWARRWLYRPDAQVGWYPFALTAARRALRERRAQALFSTAYPMTAHLVARRLHRETGLPWVADFRDLWTDWSAETGLRLRLDRDLERAVLREASAVTTVSDTYARLLRERGARRTLTLTNCFDADARHADAALLEAVPREREAVVAHLGTYYPGYHDLAAAITALGRLRRDGARPRLRLRFIGALPDALRPVIERAALGDCVEATGRLPHADAVRLVGQADLLLLGAPLTAALPAPCGWIPAKAFEYLGARRRLLVVGDAGTDVARLAAAFARVRVVSAGDEAAARAAIEDLLGHAVPVEDDATLEPLTSRATAARLATLLDTLA